LGAPGIPVAIQQPGVDQVKRSVDDMMHAREYAEAIVDTVQEPLLVLDHGLSILTANRAFFETFGILPQDTIGRSIYELDNGKWNIPQVSEMFDCLLRDGSGAVGSVERDHKSTRIGLRTFQLHAQPLRLSGNTNLILLAAEEISDRRTSGSAKHRPPSHSNGGIMIINGDTGEIADVNVFLTELLGLARTELVGKRFWETEPLRYLQDGHLVLERLQKEKALRFPEISIRANDTQPELQVEVVAKLYQEGSKRLAQFSVREITERKEFGQQFLQRARLESIGILAGGIAHDFNNLLVGILGNAGLALREAPVDTPYRSALQDVIYASQRAAGLARQLLAYASKGVLNTHPLDLSELVREIAKLIDSSIPKSVELKLNLSEKLLPVEADASQMEQIVMNLVINGAESIGEGKKGQVRVSTTMQDLSAEDLSLDYASAEIKPGTYVVLEVSDDGSGMDGNTRERLFDPFFTTKVTGRGLGLAAVQGIVHGHHGGIRVSSTLGKGTVFQVVLPAIQCPEATSPPSGEIQDLHGTGLILVVDDEPIVLQITRTVLELYGYRVLTAHNGELAVRAVRDHMDELALVILDSTMPVMGGEVALGHIKALAPALPVILVSGYDAPQAISHSGEHKLAGFMRKPYMLPSLLGTVKTVLSL
jgi:PAS domain S-box-containing protein